MALPDSFTGTSGVTLTAYDALWVKHTTTSGVMEINANTAKKRADGVTAMYYYNSAPSSADYDVTADVYYGINQYAAIAGRMSSSVTTLYMLRTSLSTVVEVYKAVSGSFTMLGSSSIALADSTIHSIKLAMVGSSIKGYWDGVEKVSVTDTSITAAGFSGFRINANAEPNYFDNFDAVVSAGGTDATASGSLATVTTSAPTATASGSTVVNASASAATSVISLSAPTGAASGTATASGALASILLSSATAQASGNASASGALAALQIIVPNGSASAGGAGIAVGALASVNLSAALATAFGYGAATGGIASVSATAPTASASSGTSASASGLMSFVGLAPTGASAAGSAVASGALSYLGLIAPAGMAAGAGLAVYPTAPQVLLGVTYGPTGADYTGTLTGGSGPSAADIAATVLASLNPTSIATAVWAHTQ